jgi:hypothetical protein
MIFSVIQHCLNSFYRHTTSRVLNIREIKTPVKPLTLQKGQGFVEGHKILTLTLTLLTPTLDSLGGLTNPCTSLTQADGTDS